MIGYNSSAIRRADDNENRSMCLTGDVGAYWPDCWEIQQ